MKLSENIQAAAVGLLVALAPWWSVGCNEEETVDVPYFAAAAPGGVFKVGEPVTFRFEGNPDFITFYSGEAGNAYDYRNRDRIESAEVTFSFLEDTRAGDSNPVYAPVFYSVDFDGDYSEEGVRRATWIDLSEHFTYPTGTGQSIPAGTMYIDELFPEDDAPIFIMYHYAVRKYVGNNRRTEIRILNFQVNGVTDAGTTALYDIKNAGFQLVFSDAFNRYNDITKTPPSITNSYLQLRTNIQPAADMELWAVSGEIRRPEDVNSGPDFGVGIKAVADPTMTAYSHTYDKPGEYTVTFVAANSSVYGREEVVRELKITVVDDQGGIAPPIHDEWGNS